MLIRKLCHYGIWGTVNDWLKSYLSNRKQFVQFNGINSDFEDVICGVPQGSILGPKLFILYINDICNISHILDLIVFADDTNLFCSGDSIQDVCKSVSLELKKLYTWFAVNKLSLNVSKTNFMVFGRKFLKTTCHVYINELEIDRVYTAKFLGVIIDAELTWRDQSKNVKNKIFKGLAILKKVKPSLNR